MALYSIPDMKQITRVPHDRENRSIINRIPQEQLQAIRGELNRLIDSVANSPKELITAGWLPGRDWTGTVWDAIYIAANRDYDRAAMIFGALVFETIIERPEKWSLGKYQVDGREIGSTTYFRIDRQAAGL